MADSRIPLEHVVLIYGIFSRVTFQEEQKLRRYLDPELRLALWIYHVDSFLEKHSELTDAQRGMLREALEWLESPTTGSADIPEFPDEYKTRARELFTPEQVYAIFYSLSGVAPSRPSPQDPRGSNSLPARVE